MSSKTRALEKDNFLGGEWNKKVDNWLQFVAITRKKIIRHEGYTSSPPLEDQLKWKLFLRGILLHNYKNMWAWGVKLEIFPIQLNFLKLVDIVKQFADGLSKSLSNIHSYVSVTGLRYIFWIFFYWSEDKLDRLCVLMIEKNIIYFFFLQTLVTIEQRRPSMVRKHDLVSSKVFFLHSKNRLYLGKKLDRNVSQPFFIQWIKYQ